MENGVYMAMQYNVHVLLFDSVSFRVDHPCVLTLDRRWTMELEQKRKPSPRI